MTPMVMANAAPDRISVNVVEGFIEAREGPNPLNAVISNIHPRRSRINAPKQIASQRDVSENSLS
jgi:hypothetical protein